MLDIAAAGLFDIVRTFCNEFFGFILCSSISWTNWYSAAERRQHIKWDRWWFAQQPEQPILLLALLSVTTTKIGNIRLPKKKLTEMMPSWMFFCFVFHNLTLVGCWREQVLLLKTISFLFKSSYNPSSINDSDCWHGWLAGCWWLFGCKLLAIDSIFLLQM